MAIDSLALAPELPPIAGELLEKHFRPQARAGRLLRAGRRSVSRAPGSGHYAIGIDFGTESGRAVLVDCADGRELGTAVHAYANGVIDERLPAPDEDVDPRGRLGAPGSRRLPRRLPEGGAGAARRDRRRPGRGGRRRDRLHLLHDAPGHRRRHAALPASRTCGGIRTPGSSCGSTTRPSRRQTWSTPSPPSAASRGSSGTAGRSPRSGSSPSRCRSCGRLRKSTRAPTG